MGVTFKTIPNCKDKSVSISALRVLFPRLYIDADRCTKGLEALKKYRREWDPDNEVFSRLPVHDWTSNYADALQQMGLAWKDPEEDNVIHPQEFEPLDAAAGY